VTNEKGAMTAVAKKTLNKRKSSKTGPHSLSGPHVRLEATCETEESWKPKHATKGDHRHGDKPHFNQESRRWTFRGQLVKWFR
jgi:hypothetical protein